ncbi:MazG family protein, partial [Virgibacillus profundi]
IDEVKEAIQSGNEEEMEKEFGDVLFVLANLTRYYKINPEIALNRSNQKFYSRFQFIERQIQEKNLDINQVSLEKMDYFWNLAKERE